MKSKIKIFALSLFVAIAAPFKAAADPITAALAAVQTWAAASAVNAFIVRFVTGLILTALGNALKPKPRAPGIKTETTTAGGSNPQTFVLGRYATAGNMVAPPYSQPNSGDTPNKFLTYVVDFSDLPGVTLSRLMVNGAYIDDLQASTGFNHAQEGMISGGTPHLYLTAYDGTQIAADPYMLAKFAADPDRPWSTNMIGTGVAYAVLTFRYNRKVFNNLPQVAFEVLGIPLYDPRLDSTVGGSGAHRWADRSTWSQTENPMVMIYNIKRGITLPDGRIWGGQVSADALPLDVWFAAMNECDLPIAKAGGGTEPQYRAGFEVSLSDDPVAVIEELEKACSAEIVEFGGIYKPRVGAPALPVYFLTDEDIVTDASQRLSPYPGLDGVYNAIHATHPLPEAFWKSTDAPARYNSAWEAEDAGRQLVASIDLPAVASPTQVQRLMQAWINDERRFKRHSLVLPPDAAILEPLDCVSWTSARQGYTSKVFEIAEISDDLVTVNQSVSMRERDAGDFAWTAGTDEIATYAPPVTLTPPAPLVVASWSVTAVALIDDSAADRRPALMLAWDGAALADAYAIEYEVRPYGQTALVAQGQVSDIPGGAFVVSQGILPGVTYEARARLVSARDVAWSAWQTAIAPALGVAMVDLDPSLSGQITAASANATAALAAADQAALDADAAATQALAAQTAANQAAGDAAGALTEVAVVKSIALDMAGDFAFSQAPDSVTDITSQAIAPKATGANFYYEDSTDPQVGGKDLVCLGTQNWAFQPFYPVNRNRKYRYTARVKQDAIASGVPKLYIFARAYDAQKNLVSNYPAYAGGAWVNQNIYPIGAKTPQVADGWVEYTGTLVAADLRQDAIYFRLGALVHNSANDVGNVMRLSLVQIEDITEVEVVAADVAAVSVAQDGFAVAHKGLAASVTDGQVAELRLTSWADPDGAGGSVIQLKADSVIAEGSVTAPLIAADFVQAIEISAAQITAGTLDLGELEVASQLKFLDGSGLKVGKASAADAADGVFLGNPAGTGAFALVASRDAGTANEQSLTITENEITLINPTIKFGSRSIQTTAYSTAQTVTLAGGTSKVSVIAIGAGGGGGGDGGDGSYAQNTLKGGDGTATIVKIKGLNGSGQNVSFTYTANGGAGGENGRNSNNFTDTRRALGNKGEDSAYGTGGAAGDGANGWPATGYGAGGGSAGGWPTGIFSSGNAIGVAGKAGQVVTALEFDLAANGIVSGAQVEIVQVGAAGAGGPVRRSYAGAAGSPGAVFVTEIAETLAALGADRVLLERKEFVASDTFTAPELCYVTAFVLGAGGSGGAAHGNNAYGHAGGGGAGGMVLKRDILLQPGESLVCTVGAGGVEKSNGTAGAAGGQSRVTGPGGLDLIANGGGGGAISTTNGATAQGGAGGTASGGDINLTGGDGGDALLTSTYKWAAGGGASPPDSSGLAVLLDGGFDQKTTTLTNNLVYTTAAGDSAYPAILNLECRGTQGLSCEYNSSADKILDPGLTTGFGGGGGAVSGRNNGSGGMSYYKSGRGGDGIVVLLVYVER